MHSIAFVGQPMYFQGHYQNALDDRFEVREVSYTFGVTPPATLAGLDSDVVFFFRGEYVPQPVLASLPGLKVFLSTEPMPRQVDGRTEISNDRAQRFGELVNALGKFDRFFHYDHTSFSYMEQYGFKIDGEFVLPVTLQQYRPKPDLRKAWDVCLIAKDTPHRQQVTTPLKHRLGDRLAHAAHGFTGSEWVRLCNMSKIGLNIHVDTLPTIEPRLQLLMACGLMVISEPLSHNDLFKPGQHFVEAQGARDLTDKVQYYLAHDREREQIAQAGLELVRQKLDARQVWPALIADVLGYPSADVFAKTGGPRRQRH